MGWVAGDSVQGFVPCFALLCWSRAFWELKTAPHEAHLNSEAAETPALPISTPPTANKAPRIAMPNPARGIV